MIHNHNAYSQLVFKWNCLRASSCFPGAVPRQDYPGAAPRASYWRGPLERSWAVEPFGICPKVKTTWPSRCLSHPFHKLGQKTSSLIQKPESHHIVARFKCVSGKKQLCTDSWRTMNLISTKLALGFWNFKHGFGTTNLNSWKNRAEICQRPKIFMKNSGKKSHYSGKKPHYSGKKCRNSKFSEFSWFFLKFKSWIFINFHDFFHEFSWFFHEFSWLFGFDFNPWLNHLSPCPRIFLAGRWDTDRMERGHLSQTWSSETLARGVGIVHSATMSLQSDPEHEQMLVELARLEATGFTSYFIG